MNPKQPIKRKDDGLCINWNNTHHMPPHELLKIGCYQEKKRREEMEWEIEVERLRREQIEIDALSKPDPDPISNIELTD